MDSGRIAWFGIIFLVAGLYVQSFHDFVIRVIGAIMIVTGSLILAFILGAHIGKGKERYDRLYSGKNM